ncbi:MAG TPA: M14 family metallopeptidase [Bacteroidales bacterium]|nr:M14 family metallopeptidase [Bacteroidales bacterium]
MKKLKLSFFILFTACFFPVYGQNGYTNYKTMLDRIDKLTHSYPAICSSHSLVRTSGGYDIVVITMGKGDIHNKPAIAVLGGVEANYMLGREIALGLAESVVKNNEQLLDKITFYIFPDVNPDATSQYFSNLLYERTINSRPTDNDVDFLTDEDPFEDLNGDGIISHIRIKDPSGRFTLNHDDERVLDEANVSLGETGGYLYFTEGIDNDDDGKFNEDCEGGVNFNRNFTYEYEEFGLNAGLHPVSEPETKAVADFLYERFNIYAVFAFGPQDNLGQPENMAPGKDENNVSDKDLNKLVSDRYHEITGLKGSPIQVKAPGNFMEWVYYHYGRYSFSTPGWWFPYEKGKNPEAEFLKYADKNNIPGVFIPWKEVNHPGFPGKKAEIGGIRPFVMTNPPADSVNKITAKNIAFITNIAEMHPDPEFLDIATENIGNDIYRIELKLHNKGVFATLPQVAERNVWTRIMRLSIEPAKGQEIISGQKVNRIDRIEGGESAEFSWLIKGKGPVAITAGAVNTGIIMTTVDLK